jgi:hypothetical protein
MTQRVSPSVSREFFGLKGFKSMLDDKKMLELYDKVLNNKINVDDVYDKI